MKINKRSVTGAYKFKCEHCHSEFEADEEDYKIGTGFFENKTNTGGGLFARYRIKQVRRPTFRLKCKCPICKEKTVLEFESGEPDEVQEYSIDC